MCANQIRLITKSTKLLIRISLKGTALSSKEIVTFKNAFRKARRLFNWAEKREGRCTVWCDISFRIQAKLRRLNLPLFQTQFIRLINGSYGLGWPFDWTLIHTTSCSTQKFSFLLILKSGQGSFDCLLRYRITLLMRWPWMVSSTPFLVALRKPRNVP